MLLVTGESILLSLVGVAVGLLLFYGGLLLAQPFVESNYGLYLPIALPSIREWSMLGIIGTSGLLIGLIPGYRAYRYSLADGMSIRV
jgi:putative ABC transport system permease protein